MDVEVKMNFKAREIHRQNYTCFQNSYCNTIWLSTTRAFFQFGGCGCDGLGVVRVVSPNLNRTSTKQRRRTTTLYLIGRYVFLRYFFLMSQVSSIVELVILDLLDVLR